LQYVVRCCNNLEGRWLPPARAGVHHTAHTRRLGGLWRIGLSGMQLRKLAVVPQSGGRGHGHRQYALGCILPVASCPLHHFCDAMMYSMNRATFLASFSWLASLFSATERARFACHCCAAPQSPSRRGRSATRSTCCRTFPVRLIIGALIDHVHRTIS
jgi:hypothetical protein